jgi:hypothetical protein
MRKSPAARRAGSELRLLLIHASILHFSVMSIIVDAFPSNDVVALPSHLRLYVLALFALLCIAAYASDRALTRYAGERAAAVFRCGVIAIGLVLISRRIELHFWASNRGLQFAEVMPGAAAVLLRIAIAAGTAWLAWRFRTGLTTAFAYLSVVALVATWYWWGTALAPTRSYPTAVAPAVQTTSAGAASGPVVVVVFDAFSYETLFDQSGDVNAAQYPNFAALAHDSLTFSNATSNYFHTWLELPTLIDGATSLASQRELMLYEQTAAIEGVYASQCGRAFTCHGASYLANRDEHELFGEILARGLRNAVPDDLDAAGAGAIDWLARKAGGSSVREDRYGVHNYTPEMIDTFLHDLADDRGRNRLYFVHTLLPHPPYVYDRAGPADRTHEIEFAWLHPSWDIEPKDVILGAYEDQTEFADATLGRIMDALRADGQYANATLLVTADHGLREDLPSSPEPDVDELMTRIPLFIHAPGIAPGQTAVDYQHIDFPGTLAQVAGVRDPVLAQLANNVALDGAQPRSALVAGAPDRAKQFFVYTEEGRYLSFTLAPGAGHWSYDGELHCDVGDRTGVMDLKPYHATATSSAACTTQPQQVKRP